MKLGFIMRLVLDYKVKSLAGCFKIKVYFIDTYIILSFCHVLVRICDLSSTRFNDTPAGLLFQNDDMKNGSNDPTIIKIKIYTYFYLKPCI